MITTRDIKVDLSRERKPLNQKTTKEVNVHVKKGTLKPSKIAVSTHTIEDVQAIAEKKRRDDIAKQVVVIEQKTTKIIAEEEKKKLAMRERRAKARRAARKKKK